MLFVVDSFSFVYEEDDYEFFLFDAVEYEVVSNSHTIFFFSFVPIVLFASLGTASSLSFSIFSRILFLCSLLVLLIFKMFFHFFVLCVIPC